MTNAKIGVALAGGYVLGRTKKAKLAIGLGMYLAGKKLNLDPKQLGKLVANSPVLGPLNDQVRRELVDATKSAATSALTQRMSGLADSLHERTLDLRDAGGDAAAEEPDASDASDGPEKADDAGRAKESASATRSKRPAKSAKASASAKASTSSGSAKSAAGKASSGARKTASSARKTASGARKTASGTARRKPASRRTSDRGGSDE
ncbi:hypothetical protein [Streptomyces sp. MOE7]|uniref:hypothetical protein n=1 Tax=Streptomyces sp. MOE7 TaxID=1961713 RepID=UPI00191C85B7|nr:hypothetical protein [Streptomyces sp. MOE7]